MGVEGRSAAEAIPAGGYGPEDGLGSPDGRQCAGRAAEPKARQPAHRRSASGKARELIFPPAEPLGSSGQTSRGRHSSSKTTPCRGRGARWAAGKISASRGTKMAPAGSALRGGGGRPAPGHGAPRPRCAAAAQAPGEGGRRLCWGSGGVGGRGPAPSAPPCPCASGA